LATLAMRTTRRRGEGRVVSSQVSPDRQTSLVNRSCATWTGVEVLLGTCDDLSIRGRPVRFETSSERLGALEAALAAGAAPHELQSLLIAELELRRGRRSSCSRTCTGRTMRRSNSITVLGRRIGSLRRLSSHLRAGESRSHPLHAAVGAIRAGDSVFSSCALRRRGRVTRGDGADDVYAATGGNPFYVADCLRPEPPRDAEFGEFRGTSASLATATPKAGRGSARRVPAATHRPKPASGRSQSATNEDDR